MTSEKFHHIDTPPFCQISCYLHILFALLTDNPTMASQQGDGPRGLMVHVGRKPFYKNRNLMNLYLLMIPGTLVVSATMGYDSSMMNGIQAVEKWNKCNGLQILLRALTSRGER